MSRRQALLTLVEMKPLSSNSNAVSPAAARVDVFVIKDLEELGGEHEQENPCDFFFYGTLDVHNLHENASSCSTSSFVFTMEDHLFPLQLEDATMPWKKLQQLKTEDIKQATSLTHASSLPFASFVTTNLTIL